MANNIQLTKSYLNLIDETYKKSAVTNVLNTTSLDIKAGARPNEYLVAKYNTSGLGEYSRNGGYTAGSVEVTWETIKADYDRGRKFSVDYLDNQESADIAFGRLAGEFLRRSVAPEGDAYTFAKIAAKDGITKLSATTYTDAKALRKDIIKAVTEMDELEVSPEGRILFITPTNYNMLYELEKTENTGIFETFETIVKVPQSRFYTAIELKSGKNGEEAGHYTKASDGKEINFLIVERSAVIKFDKHIASDIIVPANNADADAYIQKYRKHSLVYVYDNRVAGIALSHKA